MNTTPLIVATVIVVAIVSLIVVLLYYGKGKKCPDDCYKRGTCDKKTGKCKCNSGFAGESCQYMTCPNDCNKKGVCNPSQGVCACFSGWTGADCSKPSEPVAKSCPNNCSELGRCIAETGLCDCLPGWTGADCSTPDKPKDQYGQGGKWVALQQAWWNEIKGLAAVSCPEVENKNFDPRSLWQRAESTFSSNPPYSSFDTDTILNNYRNVCQGNMKLFYQGNENKMKMPKNDQGFPVYNLPYPPF